MYTLVQLVELTFSPDCSINSSIFLDVFVCPLGKVHEKLLKIGKHFSHLELTF